MKSSQGCDIKENKRAIAKLLENLEKQRKVLSGIKDDDINI